MDLFDVPGTSPLPARDSVAGSLAKHVVSTAFDSGTGTLTVAGTSTAWLTQVRLLAGPLVQRLNEELGAGTVRCIRAVKSDPYALPALPSMLPDSACAPQPSDPAIKAAFIGQARQLPREKAHFILPG
ncbi:DciA family protein [Streptomyces sp. NPDC048508]|uniref:DciA family protein n=1 Tax=Streptomyces sp. NPDC048508 TaxID=3365561 RepID=UPI003712AA19